MIFFFFCAVLWLLSSPIESVPKPVQLVEVLSKLCKPTRRWRLRLHLQGIGSERFLPVLQALSDVGCDFVGSLHVGYTQDSVSEVTHELRRWSVPPVHLDLVAMKGGIWEDLKKVAEVLLRGSELTGESEWYNLSVPLSLCFLFLFLFLFSLLGGYGFVS